MAMFPAYACFLAEGYGEDVDFYVQRSEMDSGLAKQRPGRSQPLRTRKGTILVRTLANKQAFEKWLLDHGRGTGYFDYRDPHLRRVVRARFINTKWPWFKKGNHYWAVPAEMESIG